jgi:hypothetical protein
MTKPVYNDRRGAVAYIRERGLPCTYGTLQKLASTGGGPRYYRFGNRTIYTDSDLDAWIEEKLGTPRTHASSEAA